MKLSFPCWREESLHAPELWAQPCDFADEDIYLRLFNYIVMDQNLAQSISQERLFSLSAAISKDLIAIQQAPARSSQKLCLQYLQFETSITPLSLAIGNGGANIAYDWLLNGFSDCVSTATERQFLTGRISDFAHTQIEWIVQLRQESLQKWFANLYYYARAWAALYSVAGYAVPYALASITKPWRDLSQTVDTTVFLLNWCTIYNHEAEAALASIALDLNNLPSLPDSGRLRIAIGFTTDAARFTSKRPEEWARQALDKYQNQMRPQERLQLIIASVTNLQDWDWHRCNALDAAEKYASELQASIQSPAALMTAIDQRVKILDCLVYKLHSYERCRDLVEVLSSWYATPPLTRRRSNVLIAMPNHSDGMAYAGAHSHLFHSSGPASVRTLGDATNSSLGLSLTLQGQTTQNKIASRPGVPEYSLGRTFERTLRDHYQWTKLPIAEIEQAQAMLFLPGYPHPLQALLQSETGRCLPITSSLQEPLVDRRIRRAGVWYSGEDNYSRMEAEAVVGILEAVGATCVCICGHEKTKDDFLSFYADASFDLLWLAGHGEYDRWDPSSPAVLVGSGVQVFVDDLLVASRAAKRRRLLVLNICDSAAAGVFGGIHKLGLAPMLAAGHQSVVGHCWPVDPLIAAAFGVRLAHELTSNLGKFFVAYERALVALRKPWPMFAEEVAEFLDTELVARLRNNERDLGNIFHWGSPCFFE